MDISKLSHDKAKVSSALMYKDQAIIAKTDLKMMIPSRYFEIGLATLEPEVYTLGIFALIVEDKYYSCSLAVSMMRITPTEHYEVMVDDEAYTVFEFDKGSVVTPNRNLVQRDALIHNVWELLISQARWPWFINERNVSIVFEAARKFTGVKLGNNAAIVQMVLSTILRDKKDLSIQYRHVLEKDPKAEAQIVALRSIIYGPSNTFSRLNGPYFGDGLPTALVNQSQRSEPTEELFRK